MTPEKADAIIRGAIASIGVWIDDLEVAEAIRPVPTPAIQHVILSMKQARLAMEQLLKRG